MQLPRRQQAQVTGGQLQAGVVRQHPQQRHLDAGQGFRQQGVVALAAHPVEHHPGQLHRWWAMVAEAPHQRRQGARLPRRFHHKHHRQAELGRHRCRAALTAGAAAIEQAHHPLHQRQVGPAAVPAKAALQPLGPAQQRIEVAAGVAAHPAEQLGIEVVGPHLEGLQTQALRPGPGRQAQRQQGLAATAAGRGDQTGHSGEPG